MVSFDLDNNNIYRNYERDLWIMNQMKLKTKL